MSALTPNQKREAVGKRVLELFSGEAAALDNLWDLAETTIDMPGIESFHTRLPWEMELGDGRLITGEAEDLNSAARDIAAQLRFLKEQGAEGMQISLRIDEARLPPAPLKILGRL